MIHTSKEFTNLKKQLEEKPKHHLEKKDTPGKNSNGNHKTKDAKDVDKSPEGIKNYSFGDSPFRLTVFEPYNPTAE